jgi:hypothetical protein
VLRARARAGVITCVTMTRALLLGLLLAPLACADDAIEPMSGTWVFLNGEVIKNTCTPDQGEPNDGDFVLLNNADGTFTIDPEDGSELFLCTLEGDAFTCPKRLQESSKIDGVDATLEVRVSATGTFSSNRAAAGQQDAIIDCTGSSCALVEAAAEVTFPCEVSATYNASFKE